MGALSDVRKNYRDKFEQKEKLWLPLISQSFQCLALGAKNLLDVYGYLSLAKLYSAYGNAWTFWTVQIIFCCLNVLLMLFVFDQKNSVKRCLRSFVVASGPMFCAVAAT